MNSQSDDWKMGDSLDNLDDERFVRLCFESKNGDAWNVEIADYH